ncbi:MAG: 1,2-phenylacetyl-CoA epoxidase subunit PaaC [Sneathiellaceae bacterium]
MADSELMDKLAQERLTLALRLGDTGLVLAQRLSAWCGHAPELELDLALSNVALDLLGEARMLLTLAGELEGAGRDEDELAYFRETTAFRNILLVEQPNEDFAVTIVRQFLFDAWHLELATQLAGSTDPRFAEIAAKTVKEARYHRKFSTDWLIRLGDGTAESHDRVQAALDDLWIYTGEFFASDPADRALAAAGIAPDPAALEAPWRAFVDAALAEATLERPDNAFMQAGGRDGRHSEHLDYLLAEMQVLARAHPGARW